jgi:hypothetical protein
VALVSLVGNRASDASAGSRPFAWLQPRPAPAGWRVLRPSGGGVSLRYPAGFRPVFADPGASSVAVGAGPRYEAYLNITPQQGDERLRGFASFRVNLLGDDDADHVREEATGQGLRLRGGTGSAVLDQYSTRVDDHRYTEIAILVVGKHRGWVVIAAALSTSFHRDTTTLHRVLDSISLS